MLIEAIKMKSKTGNFRLDYSKVSGERNSEFPN